MPLLIRCTYCKKLLGASAKKCISKSGKGCGKPIQFDQKIYYAQWTDPHGRTRQKKIGPSKKAAENFLRNVETAIAENKYIDRRETPKVKISTFIEEHYRPWCELNNRGYYSKKYYINIISEMWGSLFLDEITDKEVDAYKANMKKAGTEVMFNRVISTLSHMYTIASDYGFALRCPVNPAKKRFKEKSRLRYLKPKEVARLLDACPVHLRPIVQTALHTGMRKSEILGLRLGKEVNLEERRITLGVTSKTKNGEIRHIPMNETTYRVLSKAAEGKRSGSFLFAWKGREIKDIKTAWASTLEAAEIEDFHFHDLRHTFASNLAMSGVDLFVLKELLGHRDIKMTMKYAHLSPEHRTKAVSVLDGIFSAQNNEAESVKCEAEATC